MASERLKLTTQIVTAHASVTEMTPQELVKTIKGVYAALTALEAQEAPIEAAPRPKRARKTRAVKKVKMVESSEAHAVEDEEKSPWGDPDYMEFMESREG